MSYYKSLKLTLIGALKIFFTAIIKFKIYNCLYLGYMYHFFSILPGQIFCDFCNVLVIGNLSLDLG
jgi:hypothetical protein